MLGMFVGAVNVLTFDNGGILVVFSHFISLQDEC